ncbi:MAG: hypothetical protein VX347_02695 [Bacteroidota bacterium]|nr:hypothetical protein [Bacteroidota bacterium]
MKQTLFILLFIPFFSFGQFTYVPDDNFEQELVNLGYDFILDDYVETANIDTVSVLHIYGRNIADLTGIEDFIALRLLYCGNNSITTLNLSNNPVLFEVNCNTNSLISMDVRNGNNQGLWYFTSMFNPSLSCIDVNDVAYATYTWAVDTWTSFSNNCNSTSVIDQKYDAKKKLLQVVDLLGNNVSPRANIPLIYIYSDGSVEKRIFLE